MDRVGGGGISAHIVLNFHRHAPGRRSLVSTEALSHAALAGLYAIASALLASAVASQYGGYRAQHERDVTPQ
jgi:hypothetical protein